MQTVEKNLASGVTPTLTRPQTGFSDLFQKTILRAFQGMQKGKLQLRLPNGETLPFGNGEGAPWIAEIQIHHPAFFKRSVLFGPIGFAESYLDGEWDTPDLTKVIAWFILNRQQSTVLEGSSFKNRWIDLFQFANRLLHLARPNSKSTAKRNISDHYDLSNAFFQLWLDPSMTYSSAYFKTKELTLEQAQIAKYDRLCQALKLQPTDHVLEIGCGWGGFSLHAASTYGCRVTGITLSQQQYDLATDRVQKAGLSDRIEIQLKDYRDIRGQFDKIASIEMLEAVGDRYLETYFGKCAEVLKPNGLLGFQMITCPDSRYDQLRKGVDFIQKHIFPGSLLLAAGRVNQAIQRTSTLTLHDYHDFGPDYGKTLHLWHDRFQQVKEEVKRLGFDDRFIRKWSYYLCYCEAAFVMREISVAQVLYTRPNNPTLFQPFEASLQPGV